MVGAFSDDKEIVYRDRVVHVEKVVYLPTEKPCVQWEVKTGQELNAAYPGFFGNLSPGGWEPFDFIGYYGQHPKGLAYRRCVKVLD